MKSFTEYLKEHSIYEDGLDIATVVADYLEDYADEIEKTEPYATKWIEDTRKIAKEVHRLLLDNED